MSRLTGTPKDGQDGFVTDRGQVEPEMVCCEWCGKRHFIEDMNRIVNWPDTSGPIYVCHKCKDGESVCPGCGGTGWVVKHSFVIQGISCEGLTCPTCHGNGIVPGEKA